MRAWRGSRPPDTLPTRTNPCPSKSRLRMLTLVGHEILYHFDARRRSRQFRDHRGSWQDRRRCCGRFGRYVDKDEVLECLRRDDVMQGNAVKVAYMLLRDKRRLRKDCV
jgi:hypothetical protein